MTTLDDAWDWFRATREGARRLRRLSHHWGRLPWDAPGLDRLGRDTVLGRVTEDDLEADGRLSEVGLDDLAVLVLFSVFEARVREWVGDRLRPEVDQLVDPTLQKAGLDSLRVVEEGSFGRVLDPYKGAVGSDLVEEVNQVRRYRNWVAHGRRADLKPEVEIDPRAAYDRLSRFLAELRGGPAPAVTSPPGAGA